MQPEGRRDWDRQSFILKYWQIIASVAFLIFSAGIWIDKSISYDDKIKLQDIKICSVEQKCDDIAVIKNDVNWIKEVMKEKWNLK